jgi:hypothetical protein
VREWRSGSRTKLKWIGLRGQPCGTPRTGRTTPPWGRGLRRKLGFSRRQGRRERCGADKENNPLREADATAMSGEDASFKHAEA